MEKRRQDKRRMKNDSQFIWCPQSNILSDAIKINTSSVGRERRNWKKQYLSLLALRCLCAENYHNRFMVEICSKRFSIFSRSLRRNQFKFVWCRSPQKRKTFRIPPTSRCRVKSLFVNQNLFLPSPPPRLLTKFSPWIDFRLSSTSCRTSHVPS